MATIYNDSTADLYIKFGHIAKRNSFTIKLFPTGYFEVPANYMGEITGVFDAREGHAYVTELI
jgi:hypothetical protein